MYFLQCIDYVFQTKLHKSSLVNTIQNAHVLFVSISCGLGLLYCATYSYEALPYMAKLILIQCTVDLFLTDKPDIFFHHIVAINMTYLNITQFDTHTIPIQFPFAVIFTAELSSIFLVLTQYCEKNSMWENINRFCFTVTFFYTRIYLFLKYIMFNPEYTTYMDQHLTKTGRCWGQSLLYAFMFINLYWGSILVKMVYKKIRNTVKSHHTLCLNEFLLQYTYFLNPIISLYTYGNSNAFFLVDIFGHGILSVNSYYYHNALYKKLKVNSQVNILDVSIYKTYISDIISIQIRIFLVGLVNLLQVEDVMVGVASISHIAMFQIILVYFFYDYILDLKYNGFPMWYNGDKSPIDYMLHVPIAIVICSSLIHNNDPDAATHLIISSMLIFNFLFLKPFYELNHFFLHLILLYQTYAISRINASLLFTTGSI